MKTERIQGLFRHNLLILGAIFCLFVSPVTAADRSKCNGLLSVDQRWERVKDSKPRGEWNKSATELLSETFHPYLKLLSEKILNLDEKQIRTYISELKSHYDFYEISEAQQENRRVTLKGGENWSTKYNFDDYYTHYLDVDTKHFYGDSNNVRIGILPHQKKLIKAVATTTTLMGVIGFESQYQLEKTLLGSKNTRIESTFYRDKHIGTLDDSLLSFNFTMSQLTVDPIEGMDDVELVKRLVLPQGKCPMSLVNITAILYAPAVLGQRGMNFYFSNPLVKSENGDLALSQHFRDKLKLTKKDMGLISHRETGNGCPVAHRSGQEKSGLDHFNEAFFHIFRTVYSSL